MPQKKNVFALKNNLKLSFFQPAKIFIIFKMKNNNRALLILKQILSELRKTNPVKLL